MQLEKAHPMAVPPMGEALGSDFGTQWGPSRQPKSIENQVLMVLRTKAVKLLILYTPPLQNHHF